MLPEKFTYPYKYTPHPLSKSAAAELQEYLHHQNEWEHNFGLKNGQEGKVVGKMFGVLVVKTAQGQVGYLAAFSGKLAGGYHHARFVPPVYDALAEGSFLNSGMKELTRINNEIKALEERSTEESLHQVAALQKVRRENSIALQGLLFNHYHFLNQAGEEKSLRTIFQHNAGSNPPAGAGECAAPKLLHYAFKHHMKPLALAEFWWGLSPKSDFWKHGQFYPACREKCAPILTHMLENMEIEETPS
ncbi:pseudouridylate synthase [Pontibacter rugosus]|uniref:Pseudouridylate synthase n=1 Tax=Pontibacter rugosus TaxID=1745966 RepID=A0ABW3SR55_9BACT